MVDENGDAVALNAGSKTKARPRITCPCTECKGRSSAFSRRIPIIYRRPLDAPRRAPGCAARNSAGDVRVPRLRRFATHGSGSGYEAAAADVQKREGQNTPGVEGTGALAVGGHHVRRPVRGARGERRGRARENRRRLADGFREARAFAGRIRRRVRRVDARSRGRYRHEAFDRAGSARDHACAVPGSRGGDRARALLPAGAKLPARRRFAARG